MCHIALAGSLPTTDTIPLRDLIQQALKRLAPTTIALAGDGALNTVAASVARELGVRIASVSPVGSDGIEESLIQADHILLSHPQDYSSRRTEALAGVVGCAVSWIVQGPAAGQ
jgi:hypothetical protein